MWKCRWPASRICLHLEMLHNLSLQFPVMWLFPNKFSAVMVVIMLMKTGKKKKWTKQGKREGRWRKKRKKNDSFPKPKLNKNRHSYLLPSHCLKIHIYRNTCEKKRCLIFILKELQHDSRRYWLLVMPQLCKSLPPGIKVIHLSILGKQWIQRPVALKFIWNTGKTSWKCN